MTLSANERRECAPCSKGAEIDATKRAAEGALQAGKDALVAAQAAQAAADAAKGAAQGARDAAEGAQVMGKAVMAAMVGDLDHEGWRHTVLMASADLARLRGETDERFLRLRADQDKRLEIVEDRLFTPVIGIEAVLLRIDAEHRIRPYDRKDADDDEAIVDKDGIRLPRIPWKSWQWLVKVFFVALGGGAVGAFVQWAVARVAQIAGTGEGNLP